MSFRRVGIFTAAVLAAACGSSGGYCPGLCSVDSTHPTMSIEVAGGAPVLVAAEVVGGPCSSLLIRSSGEAGAPTGYAAVRVTYNGPTTGPLPLCIVRVTSLDGQQMDNNVESVASTLAQACCPTGTCCAKSQAVTVHHAVAFKNPVLTISFVPLDGGALDGGIDGGVADAPMVDAANVDGGALDGEGEIDAAITSVDVADIDTAWDGGVDRAATADL